MSQTARQAGSQAGRQEIGLGDWYGDSGLGDGVNRGTEVAWPRAPAPSDPN